MDYKFVSILREVSKSSKYFFSVVFLFLMFSASLDAKPSISTVRDSAEEKPAAQNFKVESTPIKNLVGSLQHGRVVGTYALKSGRYICVELPDGSIRTFGPMSND